MKKPLKIILALFFILIIAGAAYWQFFLRGTTSDSTDTSSDAQPGGFTPFGRNPSGTGSQTGTGSGTTINSTSTASIIPAKIPALRLLSNTPVGGYGASTTGAIGAKPASTTTAIRWVERGRGNVYEARGNTLDIATLSNTVVPKIYESVWNKNLTGFAALQLTDVSAAPNGIFAELKTRVLPKIATSTASTTGSQQTSNGSLTPYELKGKSLPANIVSYAASPKKDRLFMFMNQNGTGIGYTSALDGTGMVQIFTTPLTQVNVDWPSDNTIAITTKGSADERGYLYFVDPKTGVWKKIIGPLPGLSTKVSTDGKWVAASFTGNADNILTSIYNVPENKGTDAVIRTLADKCVWGNFYKQMLYCAVPSQPVAATYPDDWYTGSVSLVDKIWQVNAATGEINLLSQIVDTADRVIDAQK